MNKVVYVNSHFKPVGQIRKFKVPTGVKKKIFLGFEKEVMRKIERWEQTGWSDCEIDGERLANDIEQAINLLNEENYEIVTISETVSGNYNWSFKTKDVNSGGAGYGYGYGYSYTEGVTIIAKKVN